MAPFGVISLPLTLSLYGFVSGSSNHSFGLPLHVLQEAEFQHHIKF